MVFADRKAGGRQLAQLLSEFKDRSNVVVYALPRGGVVTGIEVARFLHAPFDLLVPRKIGHPDNPEFALCAICPEGDMVCGTEAQNLINTPAVKKTIAQEKQEARRRIEKFLAGRQPVPVEGKTAIIVDDGVATGLTMRAAIASVKHRRPAKIIAAVPVTAEDSARLIEQDGARVVAILRDASYAGAVGSYYDVFPQVEDGEVITLMREFDHKEQR